VLRKGALSQAGRVRAILLVVMSVVLGGWLLLAAPAQVEQMTASHAPDAGMQTADPGIGNGGGGGG
jgi:hypothetical protein